MMCILVKSLMLPSHLWYNHLLAGVGDHHLTRILQVQQQSSWFSFLDENSKQDNLINSIMEKRIKDIIAQSKGSLLLELWQRSIEFDSIIEKHQNIRSALVGCRCLMKQLTVEGGLALCRKLYQLHTKLH